MILRAMALLLVSPAVLLAGSRIVQTGQVQYPNISQPGGKFGYYFPNFLGGSNMNRTQYAATFSASMSAPSSYDAWIATGTDIRLLNPGGMFAKHINMRTIEGEDTSHPDDDYILANHPEWILKDSAGNDVHVFGTASSALDFGNNAFLDWALSSWFNSEYLDSTDIDPNRLTFYVHDNGSFYPMAFTPAPGDPIATPYTTQAGITAAWQNLLNKWHAAWPNKKILISTGPVVYETAAVQMARFIPIMILSDGMFNESFTSDHVYWSGQPNAQKRVALETTMVMADWLADNGKYFFPNISPSGTDVVTQAQLDYGWAFFNLIKRGDKQFFSVILKDAATNFWQPRTYPEMTLALGAPLEERTQISTNVYRRRFELATAYVNLSDSSTNITLPGGVNKNSLGAALASPLTIPSFSGITVYHY